MEICDDDDICILSGQDTLDGSVGSSNGQFVAHNFVISQLHRGEKADPAVQALQLAYTNLKKRYNETIHKNQNMSRALRSVSKSRMADSEMIPYSVPSDSMNAQGAAAMGEQMSNDENQRAQQGYVRYLEREKINLEAKLQQTSSYDENVRAMQVKLKDTVSDLRLKEANLNKSEEIIRELKEVNMQLRSDQDMLRKHSCDVQDHMHSSLQISLEKQNKEMDELRSKYNELEVKYNMLAEECDRLKVSQVLAKDELEAANSMVVGLQQNLEALASRNRDMEDEVLKLKLKQSNVLESVPMPTAQEMVHLKKVIADLRRTVLQQKEFLSKLSTAGGISMTLPSSGQTVLGKSLTPASDYRLGHSWENVARNPQIPVVASGVGGDGLMVKDGAELPTRGRSLVSEANRIATSDLWNNPHYLLKKTNSSPVHVHSSAQEQQQQQQQQQQHSQSEVLRRRTDMAVAGSSRNKSEVLARAHVNVQATRRESPTLWQQPRANNVGHLNGDTATFHSTYDNSSVNNSNSNMRTTRVTGDLNGRDFSGPLDNTPAFPLPSVLEQEQQPPEHYGRAEATGNTHEEASENVSEKVCPVCSRDFSQMPMNDFQTHVFECFDDQSSPETMRPSAPSERICPMCNALFSGEVSQEEFEKHVQTHFDNDPDRFEILQP